MQPGSPSLQLDSFCKRELDRRFAVVARGEHADHRSFLPGDDCHVSHVIDKELDVIVSTTFIRPRQRPGTAFVHLAHNGSSLRACVVLLMTTLGSPIALHGQTGDGRFEVTIINLTRDQTFTPVFVASRVPAIKLFEVGRPALPEVAIVAEEGDVAPLMALARQPAVFDMTFTGPPPGSFIGPGQSRTITVRTARDSITSRSLRC